MVCRPGPDPQYMIMIRNRFIPHMESGTRSGERRFSIVTPEEAKEFKKLSEENSSTQKALAEMRTMLSQFIKDEKARRREWVWQ